MRDKIKRGFRGIWIPAEIWLSDLPLIEKVMLAEIDSLDNDNGCTASNKYFAQFFNVSVTRISNIINNLIKRGLVVSEIDKIAGNRRILRGVLKKSLIGYTRKLKEGIKQKFNSLNYDNKIYSVENTFPRLRSETNAPAGPSVCPVQKKIKGKPGILNRYCRWKRSRAWCKFVNPDHGDDDKKCLSRFNEKVKKLRGLGFKKGDGTFYAALQNHVNAIMTKEADEVSQSGRPSERREVSRLA